MSSLLCHITLLVIHSQLVWLFLSLHVKGCRFFSTMTAEMESMLEVGAGGWLTEKDDDRLYMQRRNKDDVDIDIDSDREAPEYSRNKRLMVFELVEVGLNHSLGLRRLRLWSCVRLSPAPFWPMSTVRIAHNSTSIPNLLSFSIRYHNTHLIWQLISKTP